MQKYTNTIDGKAVPGEVTFDVVNPATGAVFGQCPECSPAQLDRAIEAAQRAFETYRHTPEAERRALLRRCAEVVGAHAQVLGQILSQEQGKPLPKAIEEIHAAAYWFAGMSELPIPRTVLSEDAKFRVEQVRKPLGVVGGITAWNFPVAIAAFKIAPALLTGNTIVLKPSPYTPLSTLAMGELLREVVPAGVVNVLAGGDELGARLTTHPGIRKLSFTGSVETGKKVAVSGASHLARVTLELGGNDAAIVLPDVDVKATARKLFWGAFDNCGQVCIAVKRIYAHESIAVELVDELVKLAEEAKVGDGMVEGTKIGPLNNRPQLKRVTELVQDAVKAGATVRCGGAPMKGKGNFYPPTILTDVTDDMRIVCEEQFGPALPVLTFSDVDDAVTRANATPYGLAGSVWTRDLAYGAELAERLDCGTAWVNQTMNLSPAVPFGGARDSGIGLEGGREGIESYTQSQIINVAKG